MSSAVQIHRVKNGIFVSNTYVYILPEHNGSCFVIDPGLDFQEIDSALESQQLRPVAILCTHGHFDHLGSAQDLKEKYNAPIYLHSSDLKISKSANFLLMACKIKHRIKTPEIDFPFDGENHEVVILNKRIHFTHVPGHTPGSCLISIDDSVFTGDTLYKKAVGLSDFPGENKVQLIKSIQSIWEVVPEHSMIYPGHGGSDTFKNIKEFNHPLRALIGLSHRIELQGALDEE